MGKQFRTIEEQIDILKSRGLYVGETAYNILFSENYYSVVNGYKEPFIDHYLSEISEHEVYKDGTSLDDIYAVFCFDRALREVVFHYLFWAEARIKTIVAYTFCKMCECAHKSAFATLRTHSILLSVL